MVLSSTDFWAVFDFGLNQTQNFFTLTDAVVIVDSPRFSFFTAFIALIFVSLALSFLNWMRGSHSSGLSKWDYVMRREPKGRLENAPWINQYMKQGNRSADLQYLRKYGENMKEHFSDRDNELWRR